MTIIIDTRESKLIAVLSSKNIEHHVQRLDVGDIELQVNDIRLVIERKTEHDLLSSIKDGRYSEQCARLTATIPVHRIYYFIEKSLGIKQEDHDLIMSTILSLSYIHGCHVVQTSNVMETATTILKLYEKMNKRLAYGDQPPPPSYAQHIKAEKKANLTPEVYNAIILAQIPGMSPTSAEAVLSHFGSMAILITALKEDPSQLENIKVKTRNLNKKQVENLKLYLCDFIL